MPAGSKVFIPEQGKAIPEAIALIEQVELAPKVDESVGCWCAGKADNAFDAWKDMSKGFEALSFWRFKGG